MSRISKQDEKFLGKHHQTMHVSQAPHYTPDHPDTAHSGETARELARDPYNDQLIVPHVPEDARMRMYKERAPVLVPRYNRYYDSQRSDQGWRYGADIEIAQQGTLGPAGGATLQVPVVMTQPPNWRLSQWPDGVQLFLVLTGYSIGAQAAVSGGPLSMRFQQLGGGVVNLGILGTGGLPQNLGFDEILSTPITDPGNPMLGSLIWTQTPGGASAATLDWMISFSVAYLLPNLSGYRKESTHEVID